MVARGRAGMVSHADAVTKLSDLFAAAKAAGYEDYSGALGHKGLEKYISEGQRLDQLRVLPASGKNPPKYITELSKDPIASEAQRQHLNLFYPQSQAASSSSSGAVQFDISSPRPTRARSVGAGERSQSKIRKIRTGHLKEKKIQIVQDKKH